MSTNYSIIVNKDTNSTDSTEIEIVANITVKVRFKDYGNRNDNEIAIKQIDTWLEETLNDDDQIPLFIKTKYGEQTTSKVVDIKLEQQKSA
jgi:hypothetical protein